MKPKNIIKKIKQTGQSTILMLTVLAVALPAIVILYNSGKATTTKMEVVNAADASAYSGAIWAARNLNFMAYTNRAMVSNHILVGHFVSYASWLRYVDDDMGKIASVLSFIPFVGSAVSAISSVVSLTRTLTDVAGHVLVPMVDALNTFYHSAQVLAKMYGFYAVPEIMKETAKRYDPEIKINDIDALDDDFVKYSGIYNLVRNNVAMFTFTKRYTPSSDGGIIAGLTRDSFGGSRAWIEGSARSTGSKTLFPVKIRKRGETTMTDDMSDWNAHDEREVSMFNFKKMKWGDWSTLSSGEASARGYWSQYQGVRGYYGLNNQTGIDQTLYLTAFASKPTENMKLDSKMGINDRGPNDPYKVHNISAVSRALIYHKRPDASLGWGLGNGNSNASPSGEYSNLFNPFWEVRLDEVKLAGLPI
ncbi:MAG: hypothetical protein HON94_14975 [Methylococcales bacterium]|jgi:hypothetical protein|nr:hypothetical protein [Methylococcales bacterium]MBT7408240.1 hypothetical protein [Methylococcales bacterium]